MEITTLQIVLIFIVACIAGMGSVLDEFQFHRPLVACTLIGFILGDMKTGIIIGGTLEMIALGWMNIGAAVAPDAALASIISTILVIAGGQSVGAGYRPGHSAGGGRPGVNHHRANPHRGLPARSGQRGGARQPARH
ncbi:PTS system mannose-specific EIIC component [Serratia marcescens]|uniref:PTS system mannose-specific EIIC component n=1 Tax=Serratia marcescens TaxID=615 RepID=A0A379Z8Q6_SERMA|nr:PTS system mannose-specific EIIC component [Serratia marcescens]